MMSVPTLWIVFVVNFTALGLVWVYVARNYPNFDAAKFWIAAAFVAAAGAAVSMIRGFIDPPAHPMMAVPLLVGGMLMIIACCMALMGVERFYGQPVSWGKSVLIPVLCLAGLAYFRIWQDSIPARILVYSMFQAAPIALTLPLLFSRQNGRINAGARMAGYVAVGMIAIYAIRAIASMLQIGGELSLMDFNPFQAWMVLTLVFLSMMWNFGFLMMAIDRLRGEVANLALFDDLTGAANRRQLLARLDEECARSGRSGDVFAMMMIDLDGFKEVNDNHGHAAGDECLRIFTRIVQGRLRTGDLLARMGGDEFCVLMPSTTLREGAMVARRVLEACQSELIAWNGSPMALSASIGVAQWRPEIGSHVERLMAGADRALYTAKNDGKNGYAVYDMTPLEADPPLRRTA